MEVADARDRIGAGTMIIGVGFLVGMLLEYGVKAVLARYLGPDAYGVFIQGVAVIEVLAVVGLLGLHRGLPRFMSFYRGREDAKTVEDSIATAVAVTVIGGLLVSIIVYATSAAVAAAFNEPALRNVLRLFAVAVLPLAAFYLSIGLIRGVQNARYKVYVADVLLPVAQLLLLSLFFGIGYKVDGAIYAYTIAVSVGAVAGTYYFRRITRYRVGDVRGVARKLVRFSWPLMVVSVILAINRWIDVLMLGWLTESAAVGIYEVAMAIAGVSILVLNSLNYMYMPVVSELFGRTGANAVSDIYRAATRWTYTLTLPVVAGIMIFPADILTILFGNAYAAGATALVILAAGYFISAAVGPLGTTLIAIGKPGLFMAAMLILGVADIVLNLLLIPLYGIVGAAVAMSIGLVLSNIAMLLFLHHEIGVQPFTTAFLRPMAAILAVALPVYGITQLVAVPLFGSVLLGVLLVITYLGMLVLVNAVDDADRQMLHRLQQHTPSP